MKDGDIDRLRLARTEGVGPVTYRRLMAQFPSAADAITALPALASAGGRTVAPSIPTAAAARREIAHTEKRGGRLIFSGDADYPPLMAQLADPPPVLSVLGDIAALHGRAVGVVGARNASANGCRVAEAMAADLAAQGFVVVSGMARGIDAAAHRGALHVGLTVAAVAGGLDQPYPLEHTELQARIAARGCVVTEAPLGTAPQARHFPRRNRLIAGLSLGLVVIEAALRSGSLITARLASEAGREIFAVPGSPLDPRCRGTNDLLRQGAYLTESAEDFLANLPAGQSPRFATPGRLGEDTPPHQPESDPDMQAAHQSLLALLSPSPTDLDDLIGRSGLPAPAVMAALTRLELALEIEFVPGSRIIRL